MSLLEVKNLRIEYPSRHGVHAAVKSLSFSIERGEMVGGFVSYIFGISLQAEDIENLFGLETALTGREWSDLKVGLSLAAHVVFTGGYFIMTSRFYVKSGMSVWLQECGGSI